MRYFINDLKLECLVASSFSKNFGLYCERVGSLVVACTSSEACEKVTSHLCKITRAMVSNCPAFGARIVSTILSSPQLYKEWEEELREMSGRICAMRDGVKSRLDKLQTPGTWDHITSQIGMFSFTGLNKQQVLRLKNEFHIYMTDNGRISMCGLIESNLDYFCSSVDKVVRNK
eukprot:NODE_2_length_91304_cov_0.692462.p60 type:complete len:174 gc:universal NODE_2_length_91304_cov_0.692462:10127-9606(-)